MSKQITVTLDVTDREQERALLSALSAYVAREELHEQDAAEEHEPDAMEHHEARAAAGRALLDTVRRQIEEQAS